MARKHPQHLVHLGGDIFVPLDVFAALQKKDVRINGGSGQKLDSNSPGQFNGFVAPTFTAKWLYRIRRALGFY